uniref:Uncharacterized protein n=1 Tax=Hyaloperonospora arabidopsidis (strain Emoy2) TaxID=559515 RepID=M4B5U2_HYAAE
MLGRGRDPSKTDGCREAPVGRPELASCWLKLPGRASPQPDQDWRSVMHDYTITNARYSD